MKVLYVHQFFNTPEDGGSIRSYYLSKGLVEHGYDVEMITSHTKPKKLVKEIEGIRVTYLPVKYDNSFGFWGRIIAYMTFAIKACWESVKLKNVGFCYIMTTPLTTGFIALFNKYLLGRPYAFEVGDLWPLVPVQMSVVENRLLASSLFWWEKTFYKASNGSVGLSLPITDYIQRKVPGLPTETIYNMADCKFFQPVEARPALRMKYGITDELVVTYTGTFGLANDLTRMMDVISHLKHLPIKFIFMGMGAEKEKITERADELDLINCQILGFQKKEGMKEILSISDAMFISFANHDSLFTGSPNKLFDALAAKMLVITNFEGWIKELIENEKCGFSFTHDSAEDFEKKIMPFVNSKELLKTYQENARRLAETRYDRPIQSKVQIKFLEEIFS